MAEILARPKAVRAQTDREEEENQPLPMEDLPEDLTAAGILDPDWCPVLEPDIEEVLGQMLLRLLEEVEED